MSPLRARADGAWCIGRCGCEGRARRAWAALCLLGTFLGCSSNRAALARGQGYYEDNQYERALAVWRDLERHEDVFAPTEFARYAYLRGMTDYRLGLRADARHWLSLAKVTEQQRPGGLASQWQARLEGALDDLNREVWGVREVGNDPVQSIEVPPPTGPGAVPRGAPPVERPLAPSPSLPP
jgi:hypothetical protein